jgi:hydroxyethylthiazole kinase-like uncharacterized protein yjeF
MTEKQTVEIQLKDIAIPKRQKDAHKGLHGSVAIIGGADGMVGAALLAGRAALLLGAGRIYACFLAKDAPSVDILHPEIMMRSMHDLDHLKSLDCAVIGPGLGMLNNAKDALENWLKKEIPLVLDADALNLISADPSLAKLLKERSAPSVMTPHAGEAARLLNVTADQIQKNRESSALQLAQDFRCTVVLKGAGTLISQNNQLLLNTTGNAALASGGTGDVLAGMIGSFVAQGLNVLEACKTAVYLHGIAADNLVTQEIGPIGLTASEVAIEARYLINQLHQQS